MKEPKKPTPDIDSLLRSQPLNPSRSFVEDTLSRLHKTQEEEAAQLENLDATLDALLKSTPVAAPDSFADRIMAQLPEESSETLDESGDNKIIGMPSWVFTLGVMAATLAFMMSAFTWMYNRGLENRPSNQLAQEEQPQLPNTTPAEVAKTMAASKTPHPLSDEDIAKIEELFYMDEALTELSAVDDDDVWDTLALLVEE